MKRAAARNQPIRLRDQDEGQRSPLPAAADQPDKGPFNQGHRRYSCIGSAQQPCWRHGRDRLWSGDATTCAGCSAQASGSAAVACLHNSAGTDFCSADCPSAGCRLIPAVPSRLPRACATCSISTPSFSWRWRCSFSCACAACSASAPAASGRPTIPIRAARCRARRRQRQCGGAARPRAPRPRRSRRTPAEPAERWKGIAEPGSALAAGLDAIAREDKSFDAKHFVAGARAAYEMIVTRLCRGRPPHAQESAVARGL